MFLATTAPRRISSNRTACILCQWRSFSSSQRYEKLARRNNNPSAPQPVETQTSSTPSPLTGVPKASGDIVEEFTPTPLSRPIGLPNSPIAGQNTGIDHRSWKQRRDDFVDYDKHLARRKELTQKISTPYFREWSNMRHHKGKTFLAPPGLFKAERALYFPNFYGQTLNKKAGLSDTTPALEGKVSVVSIFSSAWAENQISTFVSNKANPELHKAIQNSGGRGQLVKINMEDNALKAWLIKLFMPSLRRRTDVKWSNYFLVRRGITDEIKENIGLLNNKVGYTYLLDQDCRIRWACSGLSEGDENKGLVKALQRLVEESKREMKEEKEATSARNSLTKAAMTMSSKRPEPVT